MAIDISKLAFSSTFRYERIAVKGSAPFSITPGAFVQTITISHNLGYIPYFRAYYSYNNGRYHQIFAGSLSYNLDGNGGQIDNVTIDATNLKITIDNFGASTITGTVYYRIYAEPLS